ncbi:hypothetical protein ISCGN_019440 [Ixodes scapularis]
MSGTETSGSLDVPALRDKEEEGPRRPGHTRAPRLAHCTVITQECSFRTKSTTLIPHRDKSGLIRPSASLSRQAPSATNAPANRTYIRHASSRQDWTLPSVFPFPTRSFIPPVHL